VASTTQRAGVSNNGKTGVNAPLSRKPVERRCGRVSFSANGGAVVKVVDAKTLSCFQLEAIQSLARRTRDSASQYHPLNDNLEGLQRLEGLYWRSYVEAAKLGYAGSANKWQALCRTIVD